MNGPPMGGTPVNDWSGDWGTDQSSDENCVDSADDQWVNKPLKTVKRERKGREGEAKEKGKVNQRAKINRRRDIPAGHAETPIIISVIAPKTPTDGGKIEETENLRAQK